MPPILTSTSWKKHCEIVIWPLMSHLYMSNFVRLFPSCYPAFILDVFFSTFISRHLAKTWVAAVEAGQGDREIDGVENHPKVRCDKSKKTLQWNAKATAKTQVPWHLVYDYTLMIRGIVLVSYGYWYICNGCTSVRQLIKLWLSPSDM